MSGHLDQVLSSCASSFDALIVLPCHGLPTLQLQDVARATTVASLMGRKQQTVASSSRPPHLKIPDGKKIE